MQDKYVCMQDVYVYMQDNHVYMQDNYVYTQDINAYNNIIFFVTHVNIFSCNWKMYVVMFFQGHLTWMTYIKRKPNV